MSCELWIDELKNPYVQAVFTFLLGFLQLKSLPPLFSSLFSPKFVINHADVSFHKFCSPRVNILDKLVLGSFKHITKIVCGGQNPVNHLYIHHTIPHISVEPSQPFSTTSTPHCFRRSPSPAPRRRRFALNIFMCYTGYQETDNMALIHVEEVQKSEPER